MRPTDMREPGAHRRTGHRVVTDADGRATRRRLVTDLATLALVVVVIALLSLAALGRQTDRQARPPVQSPALAATPPDARLARIEAQLGICRSRTEHLRETIRWVAGVARNAGRRDERPLPDLFERGWEAWP